MNSVSERCAEASEATLVDTRHLEPYQLSYLGRVLANLELTAAEESTLIEVEFEDAQSTNLISARFEESHTRLRIRTSSQVRYPSPLQMHILAYFSS